MADRPCRRCRAPLEFIPGPAGKVLPVQRVRTVYTLGPGGSLQKSTLEGPAFVSHFETCPDADQFTTPRKRGTP